MAENIRRYFLCVLCELCVQTSFFTDSAVRRASVD
jgi:hypothetical protein